MNYPKMLYRGEHYEDFQQMGRDIHANVMEHRQVNSEDEEIQALEDGFGPLGQFIGTQASQSIEKMKKRRGDQA